MRRGLRAIQTSVDCLSETARQRYLDNRTKSWVRSNVEHVFGVLKLKFGFVRVRYRGLAKNANRPFAALALVNLFLVLISCCRSDSVGRCEGLNSSSKKTSKTNRLFNH